MPLPVPKKTGELSPPGYPNIMPPFTILYVDDEPDLLVLGKAFLETIGDFTIDTRESAPEGLDAIRSGKYDAVISDFLMPEMNGLEFLKQVRSEFGNIPFILFTGRGREDVVIEAINYGVDFYIQKGGDVKAQFAELAHKIRMAVERKRAVDERIESENRLITIFHASPIHQMITEYTTDRIIDINDRFLRDLHRTREEIIGHTTSEIGLMPDPATMQELKRELAASGFVRNVPVTVRGSRGNVYTSLTSMTRLQVHDKDLVYTQSVDITPQKKAQNTINALLNATPDVSMMLDTSGRIMTVNQAASDRYGIPVKDLMGMDAFTLQSEDYAPRRRSWFNRVLETKKPLVLTDDQTGRVYENHLFPVLDPAGEVTAIALYSHDATDEVAARLALKESEAKYRLVVEHSHDSIYIYRDNHFLFINSQAEELSGYSHEELMEQDIWDLIHPDDRAYLKERALQRFAGGEVSSSFVARILRKDGSVRIGEFYVDLVEFLGRIAILGIARDITEKRRAEEAIREREEQLRSLADNLPSGMVYQLIMDRDGGRRFVQVSAGVEAIHEVTAKDVQEDPALLYNQIAPEDRPGFIDAENRALATMSPFSYTARSRTPSGRERWLLLRSAPRTLPSGDTIWDGVELDVTASRQADEELKGMYEQLAAHQEELQGQYEALRDGQEQILESEEKYRTLVEHTEDGVFIIQEGKIAFVNDALADRIGYSASDMIGRPFDQFIVPEDRAMVMARHTRRIAGEMLPENYEFSLMHRDGETRSRFRIHVGFGRYRGKTAIIGTLHDVTEERKREAALAESEARFRGLTEESRDTIMLFDRDLRHIYVNANAERTSGIPVSRFIGKTHAELGFPKDLVAIWEKALRDAFTTGNVGRVEFQLPTTEAWIDWMIVPVRDSSGMVSEVVTSSRDITERKKAEVALARSEELHRKMVIAIPDIVVQADLDGNILFMNDKGLEVAGIKNPADIIGTSVFNFFSSECLPLALENTRRMFEKHLGPVEYRMVTKTGKNLRIEVNGDVLRTPEGVPYGLIYICRDVTGRLLAEEALRQSEEMYRSLLTASPDGIAMVDTRGFLTYASPRALEMYGVANESEVLGTSVLSWIAEQERATAQARFIEIQEKGLLVNHVYRMVRKDGTLFDVEMHSSVIHDRQGSVTGIVSILRDITERVRAETALHESEENFRRLVSATFDAVLVYQDNTIVIANDAAARIVGLKSGEELKGKNALSFIHPDSISTVIERQKYMLATPGGVVPLIAEKFLHTDGSAVDVEVMASTTRFGGKVAIQVIFRDITEYRRAEEALRKSEENYRRIIEDMQDVFYRTDKNGIITMISTYGARLTGFNAADELIGRYHVTDFYADPKERDALMDILKRDHAVSGYPITLKDIRGTLHAVRASSRVILDKDGNFNGVEGLLHDVTQIMDVENALRQANRQITLMTSITRHDIRNQLMALNGWLELSRASIDDPDRMLELINREQRIAEIIRQQIDFTTFFDDMGVKPPTWQDPEVLIRNMASALPTGNIQIEINLPKMTIFADPLLEKVFYNLIDNALKYAGSNLTRIRVHTVQDADALDFIIEDNGKGIPAREKKQLFQRGYGKNTGLGLFLAKEILAITGLTISETGKSGKGARFVIRVPAGKYRIT
ncbi:MAG: PAS domain S-box protein [Methanomicrobiales archaeon]|nr:PAS domain S-box protein [Methanomicrobiales archaeon]